MFRLNALKAPAVLTINLHKPRWLIATLRAAAAYIAATLVVLAATFLALHVQPSAGANLSIIYLFIVLICATVAQPGVTLFCGLFSFICYDFFLVPPVFTLRADSPSQLVDPLAFLLVAIVTCVMAERSRRRSVQAAVYAESDRLRTTLLHLISHNLRTPLTTIKTALNGVADDEDLTDDSRALLQQANLEADHLNRLIANVLQLSRLEADAVRVAKEWNVIDEVISEVLKRWPAAVADKTLTASLPDDLPLAQFDFPLIEAVLTNLVDNAFRHGKPPVNITATLSRDDMVMAIAVEDAGSGVALANRDKLFSKFSSTTSRGIGLGLAVCKGLAEAHGGRLRAEFRAGHTIFTLELPYADTYTEPIEGSEEADDDPRLDR